MKIFLSLHSLKLIFILTRELIFNQQSCSRGSLLTLKLRKFNSLAFSYFIVYWLWVNGLCWNNKLIYQNRENYTCNLPTAIPEHIKRWSSKPCSHYKLYMYTVNVAQEIFFLKTARSIPKESVTCCSTVHVGVRYDSSWVANRTSWHILHTDKNNQLS